jgi:transcriptional regulator with XRE-family HTH domain
MESNSPAIILPFPSAYSADQAIGARLKKWRENRSVSPSDLASALGISVEAMAFAERGRRHLSSTQLYAATFFLRIPMRLLFEDKASHNPSI